MLNTFTPETGAALASVAGRVIGSVVGNPVATTCLVLMLLEMLALMWLASSE